MTGTLLTDAHHRQSGTQRCKKKKQFSSQLQYRGRPTWKGATPRAAAAVTHRKQRDPNSSVPFNHYARHTALKRRIFGQRKAVFESVTAARDRPSHTNQEETLKGESGDERNVLCTEQHLIRQMEKLYERLTIAVHDHRFALAYRLKRRLLYRRQRLQRQLQRYRKQVEGEADEERGEASKSSSSPPSALPQRTSHPAQMAVAATASTATTSAVYCSFHPSTTALGVGQHPLHDRVDQRAGRYPMKLPLPVVKAVRQQYADHAGETKEGAAETQKEDMRPPQTHRLFVAAYCRNVLTDTLDDLAFTTLQGLYEEQKEVRKKQPRQFKARQRYVVGLQETIKYLRAGRVKLVLLAADVEVVDDAKEKSPAQPSEGSPPNSQKTAARGRFRSLSEAVATVYGLCDVPDAAGEASTGPVLRRPLCVTCMSRQRLSYALFAKNSAISCVGVLLAEKHHEHLKALIAYGQALRRRYEEEVVVGSASSAKPADK